LGNEIPGKGNDACAEGEGRLSLWRYRQDLQDEGGGGQAGPGDSDLEGEGGGAQDPAGEGEEGEAMNGVNLPALATVGLAVLGLIALIHWW
jgi:hypothetical protein